jgi:hypothetical protein
MITEPVSISIENDKILLSLPFSKKFIKDLRSQEIFNLYWNRTHSRYETTFSTDNFKKLIQVVAIYFSNIEYCPATKELLNTITRYKSVKYWQPTLVCRNSSYYIAASNQHLDDAIKDIPLNSNIKTLSLLAEYGISIDQQLIGSDNKLIFASNYYAQFDYNNTENIAYWLREIECDCVIFASRPYTTVGTFLYNECIKQGLHVTIVHDELNLDLEYKQVKRPIMIRFLSNQYPSPHSLNIKKVIKITNSLPVDVK